MKEIYHKEIIHQVLQNKVILKHFDNKDYPFFIIQYEPNETIIHPLEETKFLLFTIQGTIQIHSILADGSEFLLSSSDDFTILGDMEFITNQKPIFFATAKTKVTCVALDIEKNKDQLHQDNAFLHFLLQSLAKKINLSSLNHSSSLEEKLINYIHYQCEKNTLTNIEQTATLLHCSRRQLQRILKQLCTQGKLIKIKKGTYWLQS